MFGEYRISNFRVFPENGTAFKLKPVALITGANSAGKSSLVKSMMLLKEYIRQIQATRRDTGGINPMAARLTFYDQRLKLSGYRSCINRASESKDMEFSYQVLSKVAPQDFFTVTLKFTESEDTSLQGVLSSFRIGFLGETFIDAYIENGRIMHNHIRLNELIVSFFRFILAYPKYNQLQFAIYNNDEYHYDDQNIYLDVFGNERYKHFKELFSNHDEASKHLGDGYLFYFPLFEKFEGLTKEQSIRLLEEARFPEEQLADAWPASPENFNKDKAEVIEAFRASESDSFPEFFINLENKKLEHISVNSRIIHGRSGSSYDYFKDCLKQDIAVEESSSMWGNDESNKLFNTAYGFLSIWQWSDSSESDAIIERGTWMSEYYSRHKIYSAFLEYLDIVVEDVLCPISFDRLHYLGNSFTEVKRLQSYHENTHFTRSIQEYLTLSRRYLKMKGEDKHDGSFIPGDFIDKWLRVFNICDTLNIVEDAEGLGFRIYSVHDNGMQLSLADEGHGATQLVNILVNIEKEILIEQIRSVERKNRISNIYHNLDIPWIALEEPEVSLHPSMQSKLADMLYDAASNHNIHFIIETHSEYIIRRTQAIVANFDLDKEQKDNPFVVYYLQPDGTAYDMGYTESGRFVNSFGPGFFDEAGKSSLEILKRERKAKR